MRILSLAPAFLFLVGCVEDLTVLRLKPDGSGTIVVTRRMKSWVLEALRQNKVENDDFTEKKARDRAGTFGEAEFVSAEKANVPDWEGQTATYSFKDVRKLKFENDDATFDLKKLPNGNQELTVTSRFKPVRPESDGKPIVVSEDLSRTLLAGLKVRLQIEVEGTVTKCSSPWAAGPVLTVLDVDLDQLQEEEARLKKKAAQEPATLEEAKETIDALRLLAALKGLQGDAPDLEQFRKALPRIKGFKHALSPTVTLEFGPK